MAEKLVLVEWQSCPEVAIGGWAGCEAGEVEGAKELEKQERKEVAC